MSRTYPFTLGNMIILFWKGWLIVMELSRSDKRFLQQLGGRLSQRNVHQSQGFASNQRHQYSRVIFMCAPFDLTNKGGRNSVLGLSGSVSVRKTLVVLGSSFSLTWHEKYTRTACTLSLSLSFSLFICCGFLFVVLFGVDCCCLICFLLVFCLVILLFYFGFMTKRLGRYPVKRSSENLLVWTAPVHGGWSQWTSYAACGVTCGGGTQTRSRSCTRPRPSCGGRPCSGTTYQSRRCNTNPCCG